MFHEWLRAWFENVRDYGYSGVFFMMMLESTIVPIPSELIIPPAAYWASQGEMSYLGVVLAGAAGSTAGGSLTYWFTRMVGRPFLLTYGRYFLVSPDKLLLTEKFIAEYAWFGVFIGRLLPVFRHLVGFPAGLAQIPFPQYAAITFLGSLVWCSVLAFLAKQTFGKHPELIHDPDALEAMLRQQSGWFVVGALIVVAGYAAVKWYAKRAEKQAAAPPVG